MKNMVKYPSTSLNKNDKKILNKYTRFSASIIERTVNTDLLQDKDYREKL